jgi:hypothetical protein
MIQRLSGLQRLWLVCTGAVFILALLLSLSGMALWKYTPEPFSEVADVVFRFVYQVEYSVMVPSTFGSSLVESLIHTALFGLTTWIVFVAGRWVYKGFKQRSEL